jgi:hypothetical protein
LSETLQVFVGLAYFGQSHKIPMRLNLFAFSL